MNSFERLKDEIKENERIYIDTCSVMNKTAFYLFTDQMELLLLEQRKKIIISASVWNELMKHLNSKDPEKQDLAVHAVDTICLHRNIYNIEGEETIQEGYHGSFADKELLLNMIKNKNRFKQLLISSDKDLIEDALNINNQRSYLGKTVTVCYLDQFGDYQIQKPGDTNKQSEKIKTNSFFNEVDHLQRWRIPGWIKAIGIGSMAGAAAGFFVGLATRR